jgi:hypothetical protein
LSFCHTEQQIASRQNTQRQPEIKSERMSALGSHLAVAQPFFPLQLFSVVLQPPLPLQEFLPLQPLSPVLQTPCPFTIVLTFASVLAFIEVNQVVEEKPTTVETLAA